MLTVRVSSNNRITIPRELRARLGIKPGQKLWLREQNGSMIMVPVPADPIKCLRGAFRGGPSMTRELLEERARDLASEGG